MSEWFSYHLHSQIFLVEKFVDLVKGLLSCSREWHLVKISGHPHHAHVLLGLLDWSRMSWHPHHVISPPRARRPKEPVDRERERWRHRCSISKILLLSFVYVFTHVCPSRPSFFQSRVRVTLLSYSRHRPRPSVQLAESSRKDGRRPDTPERKTGKSTRIHNSSVRACMSPRMAGELAKTLPK